MDGAALHSIFRPLLVLASSSILFDYEQEDEDE